MLKSFVCYTYYVCDGKRVHTRTHSEMKSVGPTYDRSYFIYPHSSIKHQNTSSRTPHSPKPAFKWQCFVSRRLAGMRIMFTLNVRICCSRCCYTTYTRDTVLRRTNAFDSRVHCCWHRAHNTQTRMAVVFVLTLRVIHPMQINIWASPSLLLAALLLLFSAVAKLRVSMRMT